MNKSKKNCTKVHPDLKEDSTRGYIYIGALPGVTQPEGTVSAVTLKNVPLVQ